MLLSEIKMNKKIYDYLFSLYLSGIRNKDIFVKYLCTTYSSGPDEIYKNDAEKYVYLFWKSLKDEQPELEEIT
jgi:hypothetical protein